MTKNPRTLTWITVAATTVLALSGCAGGSGAGTDDESTLHVLSYTLPSESTMFDAFTEETGIDVVVERVESDNFAPVLQTRVSGKTDIDLINLHGGAEFNTYAKAGSFVDVSGADYLSNIEDGAVAAGQYDGKNFGYSISNYVVGVYYNTDLFDSLGIEVPTNWDDFMSAAETIKTEGDGVAPLAYSAATNWTNQYIYHNALAINAAQNPDYMAELKSGDATWEDNELFTRQLDRFQDLADEDYLITGAQSLKNDDAQAAFYGGKAAMWMMGTWALGEVEPAGFTPGAFALPINDADEEPAVASSLADSIVGVTSWSEKKDSAEKLLEWMASEEFGTAYQEEKASKSSVKNVGGEYAPYQEDWDALAETAVPFPTELAPSINSEGPDAINAILAGSLTPEQAVERFQELQDTDNSTGY
jgi:raffinose/stachyose/melibiose transport system substrate-binding protein